MAPVTKDDRLRDVLKSHKIIVDTCFLMHENFGDFLHEYSAEFKDNHLLIPSKVVQELKKIERRNDHRCEAARNALRLLQEALSNGLAEIRGEPSDDHADVADQVISRVVEQHVAQHNILVLTNDRRLRDWIYKKKRAGCFSSRKSLLVVRFEPQTGRPHVWGRDARHAINGQGECRGNLMSDTLPYFSLPAPLLNPPQPLPILHNQRSVRKLQPLRNLPQPFRVVRSLEGELDRRLDAKEDVESRGAVYLYNGQQVRLGKKLASGGEGTVFETDEPGIVCKIYHPNRLTDGARRKIELMVTRRISHPAICWPRESVYDSQRVFRGFLMPRATGEPLGHGLFIPTVWLEKHPQWTRRDSVRLAISILEGIDYLHRINVLLGDINPMNILVKDANTVFFVDCDSYQVEGFPCPVGSINFVAPEIQGQDFGRFLRTKEHELFAVATLLFMIMIPGKPPYSHQGGGDGAENIRKMHFPYPLGEKSSQGAPEGAWRFCWSHLTREIKESFYRVFHSDHRGQPRVTVSEWLRLFRRYERLLEDPSRVFMGPTPQYGFDLSILPHNYRYVKGKGRPLPTGGETDLERSLRRIASASKQMQASTRPALSGGHSSAASTLSHLPQRSTKVSIGIRTSGAHPRSTHANAPASGGSRFHHSRVHKWYSHPLVWPLAAPLKALLEVSAVGVAGAILGAVSLGLLFMTFGDYNGFGLGMTLGVIIGTLIGLILAAATIAKVDSGIFVFGAIGIGLGAIGGGMLGASPEWAVTGAIIVMVVALLVRRFQIGEQKAAEYMESWWTR